MTVLGTAWSISVPGLSRLGLTFVIPAADPSKESARVGVFPTRELALYQLVFSDVLFISFANLIIRFVQYSVFKVRGVIAMR